jgi:putative FmdB family regulatory protein
MPTYSYRCTECGDAFDIQQSFTDDSLTVCPACGGKLRKLFNTVGVTFNGSGFYRTDSRPAEKAASSSSESAGSAPAASSPAPAASASSSSSKE